MNEELIQELKNINTPFGWLETRLQDALKEISNSRNIQYSSKKGNCFARARTPSWSQYKCYRLNPAYTLPQTRYLVRIGEEANGKVLACTEGDYSKWVGGDCTEDAVDSKYVDSLLDFGTWLEVKENTLPYLTRPEDGDWEFKKPVKGETYIPLHYTRAQKTIVCSVGANPYPLGGYRWVKKETKQTGPRFVECDVFESKGQWRVDVSETGYFKGAIALSFTPSVVGFHGVRYDGIKDWRRTLGAVIKVDGLKLPATPLKVRFMVTD